MFSVLTALLSPRVMETLHSHKDLLFQTLRERAGVLCVQPSEGVCLLQGEWEGMKKAYMVLEEFCLQVQAQSTVQALLHTDPDTANKTDDDDPTTARDTPSNGTKGEVYPDSTHVINNFSQKSYPSVGESSEKEDMDSDSDHGLSIVLPDEEDDERRPRHSSDVLQDYGRAAFPSVRPNQQDPGIATKDTQGVLTSNPLADMSRTVNRMSQCVKEEEQAQAMLDEVAAETGMPEAGIGISRTSIFPLKFKQRLLSSSTSPRQCLSETYPSSSLSPEQKQSERESGDSDEGYPRLDKSSEVPHVDVKPMRVTPDEGLCSPRSEKSPALEAGKNELSTGWPFPYPNALGFLNPTPGVIMASQKSEPPGLKTTALPPTQNSGIEKAPRSSGAEALQDPSIMGDGSAAPNWCPFCNRFLDSQDSFEKHMMQSHGQRIVYNCKACGATLASRSEFQQHLRSHNGDMHNCPVCGKSYKSGQRLREHILLHDKNYVRPRYPCPVCYKTFTYRHNMQVHLMKLHRGKQPPKRHECHLCGQKFLKPVYLRTHLMRHNELTH